MIRLTHVIAGLERGGAQVFLYNLLSRLDRSAFACEVVSLTGHGAVGPRIRALGVPVRELGMRPGSPNPVVLIKLRSWLRRNPPDVVQTWMYHSDLIGGLAARWAGCDRVVWGVHFGSLDDSINWHTRFSAMACARLAGWLPRKIACPSEASRRWHIEFGYPERKFALIPNGVDTDEFHPDREARASVRAELGLPSDTALVGLMARFHPQKGHGAFVEAAARVLASRPATDFLLCGGGIDWENRTLRTWIEAAGLGNRFHLLGEREDMPRLMAALDVAALSSASEAGPMVVLEAMACGVPCACTDVGDVVNMIGDTGRLAPPDNPEALGDAIVGLLSAGEEQRARMGSAARRRIREKYPLSDVARRYEALYADLVSRS